MIAGSESEESEMDKAIGRLSPVLNLEQLAVIHQPLSTIYKQPSIPSISPANESSTSINTSFSDLEVTLASRKLSVDIRKLLCKEIWDLKEMIELSADDLSELFESVYETMSELIKQKGFPHDLIREGRKSFYVQRLVEELVKFVKKQFKLKSEHLRWDDEVEFEVLLGGLLKTIKADYAIYSEKDGVRNYYLAVLECKSFSCDEGVKQNVGYMKAIFHLNQDQHTVFGFCSTAKRFNFMSFNPAHIGDDVVDGFKLFEDMRFLFPKMVDPNFKAKWLEQCTQIVRIMYTRERSVGHSKRQSSD